MKYVFALILMSTLLACKPDADKLKTDLMEMDAKFSKSTSISDVKAAESFIAKSERFVKAFPADSLAPQFLFKAGGIAKTIGQYDVAFRLWDQLIEQYPEDFWSPAAAFLKGFTAENELVDREKAVQYFKDFIKRYPDNNFAEDAKRQIELLQGNVAPEDMVKEFEQNLRDSTVVQ